MFPPVSVWRNRQVSDLAKAAAFLDGAVIARVDAHVFAVFED